MKCDKKDLLVYAVTDRSWLHGMALCTQVEQALKGGATFVQLREKKLEQESLLQEALEIQALCKAYSVPFVINDHVSVAVAMDADGVHVGQSDMEAGNVREILGANKILGVSVHNVEQALRAQEQGADYLGVGAVFPTGTKEDAERVSIDMLREICSAVQIPVVAIGGITQNNLMQLAGSGIAGVAVISAIFAQKDIEAAAKKLCLSTRQLLDSHL